MNHGTRFDVNVRNNLILYDHSRKGTIYLENSKLVFEEMKKEFCSIIQGKLGRMREKEYILSEEYENIVLEFKKIEDNLKDVATVYEVNKYKLHILEIEKIARLLLSLGHRLKPLETALDNMEWNGVDERYDLERKRDKLLDQLEEAKELQCYIDRRTEVVAGYIEHYLQGHDVVSFRMLLKNKVKQVIELKKAQRQVAKVTKQIQKIIQ